jgi:ABC-type transport system involved in multi-copper enzyme maturation permease subunit
MTTALLIAQNTFREATRDRVLAGLVVAGLVLLAATQLLGTLALGEARRITIDLGLSGVSILGLFAILVVGTSLVAKEIERKTIYNLLSRPISRHGYLIGKWLGLSAALWVVCAALGLALWGVLRVRGFDGHGAGVLQAIYFAGLELSVITAIAVLCSSLSTPILSALYTLAFYVVGQWSYDLREFAVRMPVELGTALSALANVVPNLPVFNVRTLAATGATASLEHVAIASCYAVVYCGCALALATAAFESRDFK